MSQHNLGTSLLKFTCSGALRAAINLAFGRDAGQRQEGSSPRILPRDRGRQDTRRKVGHGARKVGQGHGEGQTAESGVGGPSLAAIGAIRHRLRIYNLLLLFNGDFRKCYTGGSILTQYKIKHVV